MSKTRYYIAYGSNLNLEQMSHRCPTAEVAGKAVMHGWELRFRSFATIERCKGASVPVLIWSIQTEDEAALERYEGYPHMYRKETHRVYMNGKRISAMVYIMNEDARSYSSPSCFYYNTIREGYESAGFDEDILDSAVKKSVTAEKGE